MDHATGGVVMPRNDIKVLVARSGELFLQGLELFCLIFSQLQLYADCSFYGAENASQCMILLAKQGVAFPPGSKRPDFSAVH